MSLSNYIRITIFICLLIRLSYGKPMGCYIKNVIPYDILPGFSQQQIDAITSYLHQIEDKTCVLWIDYNLIPHNNLFPRVNFTHVSSNETLAHADCWTQPYYSRHYSVFLHDSCFPYGVLHEIMHSMGFEHEHQRPDRDCYVHVDPKANALQDYEILEDFPTWIERFPYDQYSVTHYPPNMVLQCLPQPDEKECTLGNAKNELTFFDVWKIKYKFCGATHFCDLEPDKCKSIEEQEDWKKCKKKTNRR